MLKSLIFSQILFVTLICRALSEQHHNCPAEATDSVWSYNTRLPNGPQHWGENFPRCNGRMQSPINIIKSRLKKDRSVLPLQLTNYDKPVTKALIRNNGHKVLVFPRDGVQRTFRVRGDTYSLTQFHFHVGEKGNEGSEHTVDGKRFTAELHLVHENEDGRIAAIGVFLKESFFLNLGMTNVVNSLDNVPYKGDQVEITDSIDLVKLFDNKCSFYRYTGSITTPPCTQGVIWSICRKEKLVGYSQMDAIRDLFSVSRYVDGDDSECKMSGNFRRTQPLNGRTVFSSV